MDESQVTETCLDSLVKCPYSKAIQWASRGAVVFYEHGVKDEDEMQSGGVGDAGGDVGPCMVGVPVDGRCCEIRGGVETKRGNVTAGPTVTLRKFPP